MLHPGIQRYGARLAADHMEAKALGNKLYLQAKYDEAIQRAPLPVAARSRQPPRACRLAARPPRALGSSRGDHSAAL